MINEKVVEEIDFALHSVFCELIFRGVSSFFPFYINFKSKSSFSSYFYLPQTLSGQIRRFVP